MIKKLVLWNNPYLALEYHAEIDLISGKAIYKTNADNNTAFRVDSAIYPKFYECFFLLPEESIKNFIPKLSVLETWNPIYETESEGVVLDGFQWSIKVFNDKEIEIKGCQCKPKEFDIFISDIEALLQKDLSGQRKK